MRPSNFLCILEDNYQDAKSWEYEDAVESYAADAVAAAESAVEGHAEELGLFFEQPLIGETEEAAILVKNCDTGEIARVLLEAMVSVTVTCARLDKDFTPPAVASRSFSRDMPASQRPKRGEHGQTD